MALQVFSLKASPNVDAAAARRQLQNYMATMSSFRGRALPGALAMPPISRSLPTEQEVLRFLVDHRDAILHIFIGCLNLRPAGLHTISRSAVLLIVSTACVLPL